MANKRTVDPDSLEPSIKIVGLRLTARQLQHVAELCELRECSRSELFRRLLNEAAYNMLQPSPF